MTSQVAITRCPAYAAHALTEAISGALSLIGSLADFVNPTQRVLLKINHLGEHPPEGAINTNPEFLRVVVHLVREITSNIVVADGLSRPGLEGFVSSGILDVCRELDVELLNFKGAAYREVRTRDFETVETMPIAEAALDADVVITLPKLKTHMLCLMTNALKNNYGFIPGRLRANYHRRFPDPDGFSNLVVDTFVARRPHLAIVDAVAALEGTGPSTGGRPKSLGLVFAGSDCVAVDAVASAVMGLEPHEVASTRHAARRGLGEADLGRIEVLGESLESAQSRFDLPAGRMLIESALTSLPGPLKSVIGGLVRSTCEYPRVTRNRCIGCGLCVEHCPTHAVSLVGGKARVDYAKCIACFCCQEFCESDAIDAERRSLGRAIALAARAVRAARHLFRRRTGKHER